MAHSAVSLFLFLFLSVSPHTAVFSLLLSCTPERGRLDPSQVLSSRLAFSNNENVSQASQQSHPVHICDALEHSAR